MERAGHLVRVVTGPERTLEMVARDPPDIALISREVAGDAFGAIIRAIVIGDDLYRSVIALLDDDSPEKRTVAYDAGADEVIATATVEAELIYRIRSVERIVRLERRLRERVCELESALSRLEMSAVRRGEVITSSAGKAQGERSPSFLLSPTWNSIEELFAKVCGEYLGAPYQLVAGTALPNAGSAGATIGLTDVEHELRVDLALFAPPASAASIAEAFCGDASMVDDELIRDVMLELANSGMGAMKAALYHDGFKFAASVPKAVAFASAQSFLANAEAKRLLMFRSETTVVHVIAVVRRTPRVRIKALGLREGMVTATNIMNEDGAIIMHAGTRLTETSADRLRRLMPDLEVELADAS
jgi:CheY-like chemotaxis protein